MRQICDVSGADYNDVVKLALYDERIGKSHLQVPGPDGHNGFGGKCFPKDLNALTFYSLTNGVEPVMLKASWKKNMEVRKEHDWLNIDGAVTKGEKNE